MTHTHDDADSRFDASGSDEQNSRTGRDDARYAALDLEDGEVVIYDPDNHRAWIQSDVSFEVESDG